MWPLAGLREMSASAPLLENKRTSRIYEFTLIQPGVIEPGKKFYLDVTLAADD